MVLHEEHQHTHDGSTGRRGEGEKQRKLKEIGWKCPKFAKNVIVHTWESELQQDKCKKKIHTKVNYGKNAKSKNNMKILKVTRENQFITYKEIPCETMKVRRLWNDIFKVLNEKKNYQLRFMYLKKFLSNGGKIVHDNEKQKIHS